MQQSAYIADLSAQLNVMGQLPGSNATAAALVLLLCLQRLLRKYQGCIVGHLLTQSAKCQRFMLAECFVSLAYVWEKALYPLRQVGALHCLLSTKGTRGPAQPSP